MLKVSNYFDLDAIPIENLKSQYYDLNTFKINFGFGDKIMFNGGEVITEEAESTTPIEEMKDIIKKKFHFRDWQFAVENGDNNIKLIVLYPGILRNSNIIKKTMESYGWYPSTSGFAYKGFMIWKVISFDPMFQDTITDEAKQGGVLYHWSPSYNYENIMLNGLMPKSENNKFDYPERLHLLKSNIPYKEMFEIGYNLYKINKDKRNNGEYILFSINVSNLPNNIDFFYDPRYEYGYYTKQSILPQYITPKITYDFKNLQQK